MREFNKDEFEVQRYRKNGEDLSCSGTGCRITHGPTRTVVDCTEEKVYSTNMVMAWRKILDALCQQENPGLNTPIWCDRCKNATDSWELFMHDRLCPECMKKALSYADQFTRDQLVYMVARNLYEPQRDGVPAWLYQSL